MFRYASQGGVIETHQFLIHNPWKHRLNAYACNPPNYPNAKICLFLQTKEKERKNAVGLTL